MFSRFDRNPEAFDTEIEEMLGLMREPVDFDTENTLSVGHLMRRDGITREEAENELEMIHARTSAF